MDEYIKSEEWDAFEATTASSSGMGMALLPPESDGVVPLEPPRRAQPYLTTIFPRYMLMPHVKANSPDFVGVNSTSTALFSGSSFLIL
jgi:hypothetical protein